MKVMELIKELERFAPDLPVFLDDIMAINETVRVLKIKVKEDKEVLYYNTGINDGGVKSMIYVRHEVTAMNTNFPMAILISPYPNYKKKKAGTRKRPSVNSGKSSA